MPHLQSLLDSFFSCPWKDHTTAQRLLAMSAHEKVTTADPSYRAYLTSVISRLSSILSSIDIRTRHIHAADPSLPRAAFIPDPVFDDATGISSVPSVSPDVMLRLSLLPSIHERAIYMQSLSFTFI